MMENLARKTLFLFMALWGLFAFTAEAGKQADVRKFKVGDRVTAKKGIYAYDGYCPDPIEVEVNGVKQNKLPECFTSKKLQPFSGKKGKIVFFYPRTCASDVGREILAGPSVEEINLIRKRAGIDPLPANALEEDRKRGERLLKMDSCDEYSYEVDFGKKIGKWMLDERNLR